VLAIVAHPDDEVLELGGTLARLVDEGATVHVVVATAGEGGRDARPQAPASVGADAPSPTDLGEVRRREHETALAILLRAGATVSTLGLADTGKYVDTSRQQPMGSAEALRRWGVDEVVGRIVEVIRRTRPLLVLGHASTHDSTWSLHGHHLALGVATSVAIVAAADARVVCQDRALAPWRTREHRVVIAAETAERSPPQDVIAVPIDPERKAAALAAHVSQQLSLELPIAKLRAASPAVLHEYFACGVELRSRHARAPRSWLASLAARQRVPGSRWERLLAGPPTFVEKLWGTPASRPWPMPSFTPHDRAALAAALVEAADAVHANQAELAARRAFANDETVAVVTGQQVGIFGGPAFTLGKALEAWTHARALRAQGIAAIPLFWMATFDHDLDEVAEIYAGRAVDPRHARLRHEGRGRVVGPLPLGSAVADALAVVERRLAGTPHHAWTMARLRERWTAHTTFGAAFAGLLRDLVAADPSSGVEDDLGIVWLDPSSRAIAALGREVVAAALFDRTRVQGALDVGARALHDLGFAAIVTREAATSGRVHSEVFLTDEDGVRSALWFEPDGGWSTARGRRYARAELEALLHEAPERLTPSVLLRPLVQARVLPVTAFVAGPTELRYLAQLGPLHRVLGLVAPRVLPRRRLAFVGHADVARLATAGVTPQLATRAPDFARHLLRGTPRPKPASAVGESAPQVQTALVTYPTAFLATTGALAATRRLAIRTTEARPELAHAPRHAVARPASEAAALVASCEALRSAAEADGLTKTAGLARMLGNALAGGPPERAGPRAIRGVWRILRAMRREVDRRDGDTSAAVAALERSSPPRLPTLHTVDRDLGVVDLMAAAGPSLVPTLAARLVATGDGGHGPFVFEDEPSSREVLGDVAGSTLVVLDPPTPTARSGAGIAVAHPWTDERSRRALRAALHTAAADSFVRNGVEARPAEGVTPFVSSPSSAHTTKARRVAVLGMGGLGGSGKVAGEVALLYAQAGHEVWHWTGEGSRWAAEFDRFETDVEAEGSAVSRDADPQSKGSALTPQPKRPVHEAMPVPETPSLRDEARFEADVEGLTAAIVQRVQRERIDVVHVHYADVLLDAVLRAKARVEPSRRFAVMVTLHGSDVTALSSTSPRARALCAMLEHCDAVTTPSRFLASEAVQRLGIPAPLVVPNAIETREHDPDAGHALREHFRGDGAIVVAHASNLRPIKRPLDAARVVASLRARGVNARFVAAGEGPLRGELADEVASNPHLREAASLIGACSTATLREVFAAADVVLVTSESESFSLVALEALAAGTLVVGTRCGGLEELLTDTFEGDADALLAPVGDVETLTQRVLALASDPERVARLQRRAVTRTRRIHPREVQRDAYLALLERVTAGALD
jgi:glycosyltransferase involved in cell wall biosynthesis